MRARARTPEELETLFEDAFLLRDRQALMQLFHDGAVLVARDPVEARGGEQIARSAAAMWERDCTYLGEPRRILQARDSALVLASTGSTWCAAAAMAAGGMRSRSLTSTKRAKGRRNDGRAGGTR